MKPNVNQTSLKSEGVEDSVKFGIKSTGLAHIFNVLRNQLYSDKIQAVVREYSCNAVDAHVEQGIGERPIQVTLPSKLKLEFKVRDFGPALNDEEIHDVYAFYGESTKRNTNEQTGMLGIGSKSAFSYGDNFVINSFIDGKKHIWNAFIDPSQIGQISKIGTQKTDEENGIEIVIPVKEDDTDEFVEKAKGLFKYFKVTPTIKGATQFEYTSKEILFEGDDWIWNRAEGDRWSHRQESAMAIMGNIAYPFSYADLNLSDEERGEELHNLVSGNLHLKCAIGELDIAASREKLQFTEGTRKAIVARLRKVKKGIVEQAEKQFAESPTLWAAKQLLGDVRDYSSGLYDLRELIEKNVKWNGKLVEGSSVQMPEGVSFAQLKKPSRHGAVRYRFEDGYCLNAEKSVVVVENDEGHRRAIMGRLLGMAMEEQKKVALIEFEDAKALKRWREAFDGDSLKLSELPKRPLSDFYGLASSSGAGTSVDPKHTKKMGSPAFEFNWNKDNSGWSEKSSDWWSASKVDLENDKGVYVIIDKFKLINCTGYGNAEPRRISRLKEELEKAGIKMPKNVYAWKIGKRSKPEDAEGWVELFGWAKTAIESHLTEKKLQQKFADLSHACDNNSDVLGDRVRKNLKGKITSKDSLLLKGLSEMSRMMGTDKERDSLMKLRELLDRFEVKLDKAKPSFDLANWHKEVLEKYSMLNILNWYEVGSYRDAERESNIKHLVNYINVIDVCDASR